MKRKIRLIIELLPIMLLSVVACSVIDTNMENEDLTNEPTYSQEATDISTIEVTGEPESTDVPALGEDESRKVESIGESYKELETLSTQNRNKLGTFDIEMCYFIMENIPAGMEETYASIWEVGFFAFYENPETEEALKLHWWANKTPEEYIESLQSDEDYKVITHNGIDYYCEFLTIEQEATDTTELTEPYHVTIKWVEDNKCFHITLHSDTPLDESVLELCELKKVLIE